EPMRAYIAIDACVPGRLAYDRADAAAIQQATGAGGKYKLVTRGVLASLNQLRPHRQWQWDGSGTAAFPEHGDQAGIASSAQVPPAQLGPFRDSQAGNVDQLQQDFVTGVQLHTQNPLELVFRQNPFR